MASIQGYNYSPLDSTETQIRLLRIQDQDAGGNPAFALTTWYVGRAPRYTAISYTWGQPIFPHDSTIILDGLQCRIRENARYALSQVVSRSRKLGINYLWMDAICIDQQNFAEKGHQVERLGKIFAEAEQVYACVGPEADDSNHLFETVNMRRATMTQDELQRIASAMNQFGKRAYWTRLWIVQELFCARSTPRSPMLLCGDAQHHINDLHHWIWQFNKHRCSTPMDQVLDQCGATLGHYKGNSTIPNVVLKFRDALCADLRDHVYGLFSLMEWPQQLPCLEADYTISAVELAARLLPYLLQIKQSSSGSRMHLFSMAIAYEARKIIGMLGLCTIHDVDAVPTWLLRTQHRIHALIWRFNSKKHRLTHRNPSPSVTESKPKSVLLIDQGVDSSGFLPGLVCSTARTTDLVLCFQSLHYRLTDSLALVVRKTTTKRNVYRVVGKGWIVRQRWSRLDVKDDESLMLTPADRPAKVLLSTADMLALLVQLPDTDAGFPQPEWFSFPEERDEMSSYAVIKD